MSFQMVLEFLVYSGKSYTKVVWNNGFFSFGRRYLTWANIRWEGTTESKNSLFYQQQNMPSVVKTLKNHFLQTSLFEDLKLYYLSVCQPECVFLSISLSASVLIKKSIKIALWILCYLSWNALFDLKF